MPKGIPNKYFRFKFNNSRNRKSLHLVKGRWRAVPARRRGWQSLIYLLNYLQTSTLPQSKIGDFCQLPLHKGGQITADF